MACCYSYILKAGNGPNPFLGILEALAELMKWVVRKGPKCLTPKQGLRLLALPLVSNMHLQETAVPSAPKIGC